MSEIVKYGNQLNVLKFKGFQKTDMNLLMSLCAKMKDRSTEKVILKFSEIKEIANYSGTDKKFAEDLDQMTDRLMLVNCKIITNGKIDKFVLFPRCHIDLDTRTVTISVDPEFAFLLNELEQYTIFELEEFISLNSKYSKNLYRLLKQWRTVGKYIFNDLEEFRKLMDIPTAYTNKYMMNECVSVAIEEISKLDKSFIGFKCEPVYAKKRGKPLEKLIFTWKAEKNLFVNENDTSDTPKRKSKKPPKKTNTAAYFNNYPQREYTSEYYDYLEQVSLKQTMQ